jgi:hypothetical protein
MAFLPQVPRPHTYTTLSNLGSPPTQAGKASRQLLTVVEGLMERLARGGQRGHRGRDADVDIDLSYE